MNIHKAYIGDAPPSMLVVRPVPTVGGCTLPTPTGDIVDMSCKSMGVCWGIVDSPAIRIDRNVIDREELWYAC